MTVFFDACWEDGVMGRHAFRSINPSSPPHPGDNVNASGDPVAGASVFKADSLVDGFCAGDKALRIRLTDWAVSGANGAHAHEYSYYEHRASSSVQAPTYGAWDGANGFMGKTRYYVVRWKIESPYNVPVNFCVFPQILYPTVLFIPFGFNFAQAVSSTLASPISSTTQTTVTLTADNANLIVGQTLVVSEGGNTEYMRIIAGNGSATKTVQRGAANGNKFTFTTSATVQMSNLTVDFNCGKAIPGNVYDPTLGWQVRRFPVDVVRPDTWCEAKFEVFTKTDYATGGYVKVSYRLASRTLANPWVVVFDSRINNYSSYLTTGSYNALGVPTVQWGTAINNINVIDQHGLITSGSGAGGIAELITHYGLYRDGPANKTVATNSQSDTIIDIDRFVSADTEAEVDNALNQRSRLPNTDSFFPTTGPFTGVLGSTSYNNPQVYCKISGLPGSGSWLGLQVSRVGSGGYEGRVYNNGHVYQALLYVISSGGAYTNFGMTNPYNDGSGVMPIIAVGDWIGLSCQNGWIKLWWRRSGSRVWMCVNQVRDSTWTSGFVNITKNGTANYDATSVGGGAGVAVKALQA